MVRMVRNARNVQTGTLEREIRTRILMLVDELLRRGVPESEVQGILDWVDAERVGPRDLGIRGGEVKRRPRTPGDMGD